MPTLRSPAGRRLGVHVARVVAFSAALAALTTIVVADVIAAEAAPPAEAPRIADLEDDAVALTARGDDRVAVLAAASVTVPDAPPPELMIPPPEPPVKKKRRSKLKLGRFEGY